MAEQIQYWMELETKKLILANGFRRYKMIKYIKIVNYMSGDKIEKQIQDIIDNGMMDKDTRLFFKKSNCVTMKEIKMLLLYFDIVVDDKIDNVVFLPKEYFIKKFVENGESFEYKKY